MEQELLNKIKLLEEENERLKKQLEEIKEHLKKYTSPDRNKKYYEENKQKLLTKMRDNPIASEKRKEYNKKYYLKKKCSFDN
jgi:Asp-tRNA(Asn)/Glu-tRNA(Gln) amidotransferase C subunit